VKTVRARPSAGNNLEIGRFNTEKPKVARARKLPAEPLSDENSPIVEVDETPAVEDVVKRGPGRPKKLTDENSPLAPSA
jgi:hypothetical protein